MKFFKKIIVCTALGGTLLTSCNKTELTDLNINPQALGSINLNFLFTNCQLGVASGGGESGDNRYIDWRTNIGMCSMAIQQLANAGGGIAPGDKYTDNPETASAPYEFIMGGQLKMLGEILAQTGPGGSANGKYKNLRQAARILRAFLFCKLTDYYGSVPYTEAMQASKGVFFPKYDKQKLIYLDCLKELKEATAAIGSTDAEDFPAADLYYRGDITKWKKWGYSLMLRIAMRISNVDPTDANDYVSKAVAGGVFTSNDDNVWVPMSETPSLWTNQNGISRAFYPGDGGQPTFLSKTFVDRMKGANAASTADDDPRLMILCGGIGAWTPSGWFPTNVDPLKQKGMPNGKDQTMLEAIEGISPLDQVAVYSRINTKLLDRADPYMLMNCGEVRLLLAEAAERSIGGLTPSAAAAYYKEGVKASMQMYTPYDASLTISDAKVVDYLTAYPYTGKKDIYDQLWINHFMNWWEAWSDWRRTGFPVLTPTNYPGNVTNGTIPQRLKYPNAEVAGNPNFSGASANDYVTKLWFAGGPE